ncbi:MAG: hypothetical protein AMJ92_01970 [candidate division Zixibacteria bacterium SM23_81]|nr:MAG: hypothetical protein AMJ92_01970 [candidate division Zixibacteria bacterium SM23_81]
MNSRAGDCEAHELLGQLLTVKEDINFRLRISSNLFQIIVRRADARALVPEVMEMFTQSPKQRKQPQKFSTNSKAGFGAVLLA